MRRRGSTAGADEGNGPGEGLLGVGKRVEVSRSTPVLGRFGKAEVGDDTDIPIVVFSYPLNRIHIAYLPILSAIWC